MDQPTHLFANADDLKARVRASLTKETIDTRYKENGLFQKIAKSSSFENATFLAISLNAIWIGIDVDYNKKPLYKADWIFVAIEMGFCIFFVSELSIRFLAFRRKVDCLKDAWFMFDSLLVFCMVLDSLVFTAVAMITGQSASFGGASVLRLMRLARLTRMARLARMVPELMILVQAMISSARSVGLTMVLLTAALYVFAVVFVQLLPDTKVGKEYYDTVGLALYTLLIQGILPDQAFMANLLLEEYSGGKWYFCALFLLFVAVSSLLLINMLIGIICEVVSAAAGAEKERADINFMKEKLGYILGTIDENGDGSISKGELLDILMKPETVKALSSVGVDARTMVDHVDFMFIAEGQAGGQVDSLSFEGFINETLKLRENNSATVRDISELRRNFHTLIAGVESKVQQGSKNGSRLAETQVPTVDALSSPNVMNVMTVPVAAAGAGVGPIDLAPEPEDKDFQACLGEINNLRERMGRLEGLMLRTAKTQCLILEKLSTSPPPPKLLEAGSAPISPTNFASNGAKDMRNGNRTPGGGAPSSSWLQGCSNLEMNSAQRSSI